jgi:hypothetical protein
MSLPTASAILSRMPNSLRVSLRRGEIAASIALRTFSSDSGGLGPGGIDSDLRTVFWTIASEFSPGIRIGDLLYFNTIPATTEKPCVAVGVGPNSGGILQKTAAILLSDTITIDGQDCSAKIGAVPQDLMIEAAGFRTDDTQTFFIPQSLLPSSSEILAVGTPVVISGKNYAVQTASTDPRCLLCCVTVKRRGAE